MDQNIVFQCHFIENIQKLKTTLNETDIWDFVDCLMKELEISKNHNKYLEEQLVVNVTSNEESISAAYVKIKEQNNSLSEKYNKLSVKLNESEKSLKEMKIRYEQREKEFFEELQTVQVNSAMDFDQIEQKLRWQISEANKEIQKKQLIIDKFETQLRNMEEQQFQKNYSANALFFPPTNETVFKENNSVQYSTEEIPVDDNEPLQTSDNIKGNSNKKSELTGTCNSLLRSYEPLQVKCSVPSEDKIGRMGNTSNNHITPLFKGKNYLPKRCRNNKSINSCMIPPLIPCSSSKYPENKKRKLHDPDDLSYLVQLMNDDVNEK
ncbi:hypothetical protein WA026_012270 [Henosepilachna vigintioctopunctata]|uniref:Uncharacterized protein n=1 Tax=Henosepilachna vigintioctopunctata TaxID=420089 RepID=A0AAW1V6M0_9CUCU